MNNKAKQWDADITEGREGILKNQPLTRLASPFFKKKNNNNKEKESFTPLRRAIVAIFFLI